METGVSAVSEGRGGWGMGRRLGVLRRRLELLIGGPSYIGVRILYGDNQAGGLPLVSALVVECGVRDVRLHVAPAPIASTESEERSFV